MNSVFDSFEPISRLLSSYILYTDMNNIILIMNVEKGIANEVKSRFLFYLLAYITDFFYLCIQEREH